MKDQILDFLTWPGGRIASNLSTPNMPKLDNVKVPAVKSTEAQHHYSEKDTAKRRGVEKH